MAMPLAHHRFTVDEYHRMGEAGILTEDDRVELLDGEIVAMSPIGDRHVGCVIRLTDLLVRRVGDAGMVSVRNPLVMPRWSEPQPDLVVIRRRPLAGAWRPYDRDTLLVIEVADSSIGHDRQIKVPLYAAAGIPEVWLVDLTADRIEVYREPGDGTYATRQVADRAATLQPLLLPSVTILALEILS